MAQQPISTGSSPLQLKLVLDLDDAVESGSVPFFDEIEGLSGTDFVCDRYYPPPSRRHSDTLCFSPEELLRHPVAVEFEDFGREFRSTRFHFRGELASTTDEAFVVSVVCKLEVKRLLLGRPSDSDVAVEEQNDVWWTHRGLRKEASVYSLGPLRVLQGDIVPEFYGFYEGKADRRRSISCLFTQYHGKEIRQVPANVWNSMNDRINLFSALKKLHEHGLMHHDIANEELDSPKNVVVDLDANEPRFFIIDFEDASPHEACDGASPPNSLGSVHYSEFCSELTDFGESIDINAPRTIILETEHIPLERARSPQELLTSRFKGTDEEYAMERYLDSAERQWNEYMDRHGHLSFVQDVINTLNKAPQSGTTSDSEGDRDREPETGDV